MSAKYLCAVCGSECPPRFWMETLTDEVGVIYYLYFDTEECVQEHMRLATKR